MITLANKRPYKFFSNKISIIFSSIISAISLIAIIFLSFEINSLESIAIPVNASGNVSGDDSDSYVSSTTSEDAKKIIILRTIKDVAIVILSILGTNLMLSLIIQIKSQNDIYDEFITEDLLQNRKFLESMSPEKRKIILKNIEKIDYMADNEVYSDLINTVRDKISKSNYEYYFTFQNTNILCNITNEYIEKEIIRTMKIKSFDKPKTISNFILTKSSSEPINGVKGIEITKLVINGEKQSDKSYEYQEEDNNNVYLKNSQYNKVLKYVLKNDITFYHNKETNIEITYITRVPINDMAYTSRLSVPCKHYEFHFRINGSKKYKLYSRAYGFQDDASNTPAGSRQNEVNFKIENWSFPTDGVFISFNE